MTDAFIYDALRTPRGRGKATGALHEVSPIGLVVGILQALRDRHGLDTALVDDVVLGCVEPVGDQGSNIARVAALAAGYDEQVAGVQINRFCASGLEACNMAAAQVLSGQADLVVGGGIESMSRVPMQSSGGAWFADPKVSIPTRFIPQGISADLIATTWGYTRQDVDAYAVESQRRAAHAWEAGYFERAVVPVKDASGLVILDKDEHMRPEATLESLSSLKPAFESLAKSTGFDQVALMQYPEIEALRHVHHAGNSSGIVDGAAAVLIGNAQAGQAAGLTPRAKIRGWAVVGSEPTIMLTGPSFAAEKALKRAGMTPEDIDLWELNEAFAAVVLRFMEALDLPHDRINVNGGAIAMGHPLGATGAMILGTALDELERRGLGTALITLCVGAGMGIATIVERV